MDKINTFDIRTSITEKVIDVFDMMLSMEVEPSDDVSQLSLDGDRIVGSVSFAGEVIGIVNIYVSESFSRIITASMLGMEVEEIEGEEEVKDVLCEVSNIIGGKLKSDFSDAGFTCQLSTPSITSGTDFKIESLNMARYERFAFRHQEHTVFVETGVKMNSHTDADVHDPVPETEKQLKPIDVDVINTLDIKTSIADKVIEVFDMMLSMEVESSDAVLESGLNDPRMVASVNFTGEAMGIINIQVSDSFAHLMTASMLGMEVEEIEGEEEVKDVLGEVSNIIGGKLKSDFSDAGLTCQLSTPSITSGTDFKIESLNMARHERFSFRYKEHAVTVEVAAKMESLVNCAVQDHPSEVAETLKTIEDAPQDKIPEVVESLKAIEGDVQDETPEVAQPLKTIEDAPRDDIPESALDIKTSVVEKVIDVFDMMLSMEVEPSDEVLQLSSDTSRVVGSVNFAGEVMGSVNIQVSEPFSRLMTASMLGMELEEIEGEEEVKDVLGEVSNIIGGNLKSDFCDAGLTCVLSTPSITRGTDFKIESLNMARHERFSFRHQQDTILVETCVKINKTDGVVQDQVPETKEQPGRIDPDLINTLDIKTSIVGKVIDVFDMMISMEIEPSDEVSQLSLDGDRIVGSVSFAGDVMGIVNIQVSEPFSRIITASMLGMEVEEIEGEEEVKDVLGEVSNIIGGNLKSDFCDAGFYCELSTPSITSGTDFKIESLNMARHERFAFRYKEHIISVEMGVKVESLVNCAVQDHPSEVAETLKTIEDAVQDETPGVAQPLKSIDDASQEKTPDATETLKTIEEPAQEKAHDVTQPLKTVENALQEKTPDATEILKTIEEPAQEKAHDVAQPLKTIEDAPQEKAPASTEALKTIEEPAQEKSAEVTEQMGIDSTLDFLLDIPLEIIIELGRTKMSIDELLNLGEKSVVELAALEGEPVDIRIGKKLIARGEVVIEDGKYGIRITEIMNRMERIKSLV